MELKFSFYAMVLTLIHFIQTEAECKERSKNCHWLSLENKNLVLRPAIITRCIFFSNSKHIISNIEIIDCVDSTDCKRYETCHKGFCQQQGNVSISIE